VQYVAFAMRSLVLLLAGLLASAALIYGEFKTPENAPIESLQPGKRHIETVWRPHATTSRFTSGNTDIYADYAQYNSSTHDVELGVTSEFIATQASTTPTANLHTETKKDPGDQGTDGVTTLLSGR